MAELEVITLFLFSVIVYSIPLLYGTAGEIMIEKSGSLNLGVEGTMAIGAVTGYVVACRTNSLFVGVLVAFLAAAVVGAAFAFFTVTLQANQNVTGLTITTFGVAFYFFLGNGLSNSAGGWPMLGDTTLAAQFAGIEIPLLSKIPVIGKVLFSHNILVYLAVVIAQAPFHRREPGCGRFSRHQRNALQVHTHHARIRHHGHRRTVHGTQHGRYVRRIQLLDQRLRLDRHRTRYLCKLEPGESHRRNSRIRTVQFFESI